MFQSVLVGIEDAARASACKIMEDAGIESLGSADSGREALKLIGRLRPDIVVMDTQLPDCTALELVERIASCAPDSKLILAGRCTNYAYAQLVTRFGIRHFLAKPMTDHALLAELLQIKQELAEAEQLLRKLDAQRGSAGNCKERLRTCYVEELYHGVAPRVPLKQLNSQYGFSFTPGAFCGMALKVEHGQTALSGQQKAQLQKALLCCVEPLCSEVALHFREDIAVGVCGYRSSQRERLQENLQRDLAVLEQEAGGRVTVAIGPETLEPEELRESVQAAQRMLEERLVLGSGIVLDRLPTIFGIPIQENIAVFSARIQIAVERKDSEWAREAVHQLHQATIHEADVTGQEIWAAVRLAEQAVNQLISVPGRGNAAASFIKAAAQCDTTERLFERLQDYVLERLERATSGQEAAIHGLMQSAKRYMEQHYMDPISLEEVAAQVGFNPSYFSTVFKKNCGEGFVDYLTGIRVGEAKKLLCNAEVPITEICFQIGYRDLKHFNRVFKRLTGLTPSEFKRQNKQEAEWTESCPR